MTAACSQPGCPRDVTHRIYWPGRGEAVLMCELHEERAQSVAAELGFELTSDEITVDLGNAPAVEP